MYNKTEISEHKAKSTKTQPDNQYWFHNQSAATFKNIEAADIYMNMSISIRFTISQKNLFLDPPKSLTSKRC